MRAHRARAQGDEAGVEAREVEEGDHDERLPVGRLQRAYKRARLLPQAQLHLLDARRPLLGRLLVCAAGEQQASPLFCALHGSSVQSILQCSTYLASCQA